MKKKFLMLLTICLLVCACAGATAEGSNTASLYVVTDTNGLIRNARGVILGATEEYETWRAMQKAAGNTVTQVAYRPLTIQNGYVYDQNRMLVGILSTSANLDYAVGELGDSSIGLPVLCAMAAAALGGAILAGKKRRMAA